MQGTRRINVVRLDALTSAECDDDVVVEEPLEIRVNNLSVAVTMRTPGDDFDLAFGLLWTEGFIHAPGEIGTIAYCPNEEQPELMNIVNVTLVDSGRRLDPSRVTWMNSSCGLCAKSTLEALYQRIVPIQSSFSVDFGVLAELPDRMRHHQPNFDRTGGIHAAGLFNDSGHLLMIREDLGRHNAVDKVLGAAVRSQVRLSETVLMVSGRLGFEIAQKAAAAGIPVVGSISAPSSLAVELAQRFGISAVGFIRNQSMNIYSHKQRILNAVSERLT